MNISLFVVTESKKIQFPRNENKHCGAGACDCDEYSNWVDYDEDF